MRSEVVEDRRNEDEELTFWKKSVAPVPGRPEARRGFRNKSQLDSNSCVSFEFFQNIVSDAWEIGDEKYYVKLDKQTSKETVHPPDVISTRNYLSKSSSSRLASGSNTSDQPYAGKKEKVAANINGDSVMVHNTYHYCNKVKETPGTETMTKLAKFEQVLQSNPLDLEKLRYISWSGVPMRVRPIAWRLLAGYLPVSTERRQPTLERKRLHYWNLVEQYFKMEGDESFQDTYKQIQVDIPRMSPLIALFKQKTVQEMFERILLIWAIRHPASGYVQGINDLVTPFYMVFLQEFLPAGSNLETFEVNSLPKEHQNIIEADSYWCLSKFLNRILDNYIFAQLGIQRKVNQLKDLTQRVDIALHNHLLGFGIDYLQFSFRWMNNLLMREIPLCCSIRLWDTYLAESDNFPSFHLYVCAAFLLHWRQQLLLERDFQGVMQMLQNLPTQNWTAMDVEVLVAEAYRLKFTFADARNHLPR